MSQTNPDVKRHDRVDEPGKIQSVTIAAECHPELVGLQPDLEEAAAVASAASATLAGCASCLRMQPTATRTLDRVS